MTTLDLLEDLKEFVERATRDIILESPNRDENGEFTHRRLRVYKYNLPEKEDEKKATPYILLQAVNGKDTETKETTANIRIVIVTYSSEVYAGSIGVQEIIERLRIAFRRVGLINRKYGILDIEWLMYPQDTKPYYIGEMTAGFQLPEIKREIQSEMSDLLAD